VQSRRTMQLQVPLGCHSKQWMSPSTHKNTQRPWSPRSWAGSCTRLALVHVVLVLLALAFLAFAATFPPTVIALHTRELRASAPWEVNFCACCQLFICPFMCPGVRLGAWVWLGCCVFLYIWISIHQTQRENANIKLTCHTQIKKEIHI
jgi:hypothetical protein